MSRPRASVPPDAIRIEDEVWQEAFTRREPARPRARLHAIEGGRSTAAPARPQVAPAPVESRAEAPWAEPRPDARAELREAALAELRAEGRPAELQPRAAPAELRAEAAPAPAPRTAAAGGVSGRRTVTIRGYGAERNLPWPDGTSRRPQRKPHERAGFRPDRIALWALMLCVLLVIVAVASPHG